MSMKPDTAMTVAEKLKLAEELGVSLPHYTNTSNPVDFPKSDCVMNERIQELAKEAGFEFWEDEAWRPTGQLIDWSSDYDNELAKLASLIKRDCINQIRREWFKANNDPHENLDDRAKALRVGELNGLIKAIAVVDKVYE